MVAGQVFEKIGLQQDKNCPSKTFNRNQNSTSWGVFYFSFPIPIFKNQFTFGPQRDEKIRDTFTGLGCLHTL